MDERAVFEACDAFRLVRDLRRATGQVGQLQGSGVGASPEFFDFRHYLPGDDPRHVDWAVYGRTGELTVRLYREEITPGVDVLLDNSRSMAIADGRKGALARELAAFTLESTRQQGGRAALHLLGDGRRRVAHPREVRFDSATHALFDQPGGLGAGLRPGGTRVLISDFLTPVPPQAALRQLASHAAHLLVLMVLGPWEAEPPAGEQWTLRDVETSQQLPAEVSRRARQRYLGRLHGLRAELADCCRTFGAVFAWVRADAGLVEILRRDLIAAGVVQPV